MFESCLLENRGWSGIVTLTRFPGQLNSLLFDVQEKLGRSLGWHTSDSARLTQHCAAIGEARERSLKWLGIITT
jgi:hypothetical protein